jgi:hypothetical protein
VSGSHDAVHADEVAVPLQSRRRRRGSVAQKINHIVPAFSLAAGGGQLLMSGARGAELALAFAELVTSALFIAGIVRDVRASRRPAGDRDHAHGIDWTDVFAAGMLLAEAAERWHVRHRVPGPTLLTAAATLGVGLFHGRLAARRQRRRSLRITAEGVWVGGRPFRSWSAPWHDIATIEVGERDAEIRTRTGRRRRIDLLDMENAADVRAALIEARARVAGVPAGAAAIETPA